MTALFNVRSLEARKTSARCDREKNFLSLEIFNTLENRLSLLNLKKDPQTTLMLGEDFPQNKIYPHYQPLFPEQTLPFPDHSFQLILDYMTLHWINDLPGHLREIRRIATPQGTYLAGFLAEKTLQELRHSLLALDLELFQGAKARVSPLLKIQIIPDLFKNLGFQQCIVDHEEIKVVYQDVYHLIQDLRLLGETCALQDQESPGNLLYHRRYFQRLNEKMLQKHPGPQGGIQVTFDIAYVYASPSRGLISS